MREAKLAAETEIEEFRQQREAKLRSIQPEVCQFSFFFLSIHLPHRFYVLISGSSFGEPHHEDQGGNRFQDWQPQVCNYHFKGI